MQVPVGRDWKWRSVEVVRGKIPVGVPEEVRASDAEVEHGLCVGFGLFTRESVVAEGGSDFRPMEVA